MAASTHPDVELIAAIARGDKRALGSLYERYSPLMLGLAMRMLKNQQAAEDLVHDVFVEVWRRAGDYNPERSSVRTWISVRVRSRCLDRIRATRVRKTESMEARQDGGLRSDEPKDWADDLPETTLDAIRMRYFLRTLPENQRVVIELGYLEGMTSSEISIQLNIPIGTVKSRTRAALASLRKSFKVKPHV